VEEEARSARIYIRLADTAELHRDGHAGLWRDPDLGFALDWQEKNHPNPHWAQRYHPEFKLAMEFLQASQRGQQAEIAERDRAQQERLAQAEALAAEQRKRLEEQAQSAARLRRFLAALVVAVLLALLAAGFAFRAYSRAEAESTNANRQKKIAEEEKTKAETAKQRAEENQKKAEEQTLRAQQQTQVADAATEEAKRQKEVADSTVYVANMNLARAEFESGNTPRGF